mmetsp:Transcript_12603/g.15993  ORF Transcript_12603/g.15993 Transcript_12603/m.15993 type:complete len:241 (-) Transcript_12603:185-907(-)
MSKSTTEDLQAPLLSDVQEEEHIAVPQVPVVASPADSEPLIQAPTADAIHTETTTTTTTTATTTINDDHIPRGKWRDGFCDCCSPGIFHPSFLFACCCPSILLGQVMVRFNLGLTGSPTTAIKSEKALYVLLALTAIDIIIFSSTTTTYAGGVTYMPISAALASAWSLYLLFLMFRTRSFIRQRYEIESGCCGELEDCLLPCCCTTCTVSQMARHTADYDNDEGKFLTTTGLSPNSPSLV